MYIFKRVINIIVNNYIYLLVVSLCDKKKKGQINKGVVIVFINKKKKELLLSVHSRTQLGLSHPRSQIGRKRENNDLSDKGGWETWPIQHISLGLK